MQLPDFLEKYRARGEQTFLHGRVQEIHFSGSTYVVTVSDESLEEPVFVFLQLEWNRVKDIFCNCERSEASGGCEHMAAACHAVFLKRAEPLGIQFDHSLFKALFFQLFKKSGIHPLKRSKEGKTTTITTFENEPLFSYTGTIAFDLAAKKETEETSIKFSNLSEEELELWRLGRPSIDLRFELHPFSDLAKQLFLKQDKELLKITFHEKENSLPDALTITFSHLTIEVPLSPEELEAIIPTLPSLNQFLKNVSCNLPLFSETDSYIDTIHFDEKKGVFFVTHHEVGARALPKKTISLGPYRYAPHSGFYAPAEEKPTERYTTSQAVGDFLNRSLELIKSHLPQYSFYEMRHPLTYKLFLDDTKTLTIDTSLFEANDITFLFANWAYVAKKKSFYRVEAPKFDQLFVKIPERELSSFILSTQSWLNTFEGFQVHIVKIQEEMSYRITDEGALQIFKISRKEKVATKEIDCGNWIYIKGDGFYPKAIEQKKSLITNAPIPHHLVVDFIRENEDRLLFVPGFFTSDSPIQEIGLSIQLRKKGIIEIAPDFRFKEAWMGKVARMYDEFVFLPERGFYRIPSSATALHYTKEIRADAPSHWNSFFLELLPKLKKEFSCSVDPRLEQPEEMKIIATPLEKGSQHALEWDVELSLKRKQTESEAEVNINELISAMKRGERFLPTDVGTIDLSDSRLHWLEAMKGKRVQKLKKGWRLTPIDLFRIEAYEPVSFVSGVEQKAIFERLLQCRPHTPPDISELHSELRTYQKNGVEWLWFLYQNGLSGLLCDDMGVGKTHQAMGLMAAIFHEKKQENARPIFLIIAPTSLIFHWEEKLKTYLPNLKVKTYVGLGRTLDDFPGNCDILLTSYGIFRNEALSFKRFFFDAAFFDELQIAKNHVSQIYAALLRIRARLKIGLTGTPIENQLRELKTLFDLVLPGYMPEDSDFREFFVKPLERGDTPDRRSLLARFVKPFVLRRRKQDVLPELPEKTEDFYYAELIGEQKTLYKQVAMRESRSLIDLISKEAEPIPYMHIFALLSALKQISNHPACYLKDVGNYERYESGKWEAFCELLEEAQESQQKVVVFSQYLAMLDIMATYLDQSKISYAQIRGETKNRGQEVGRFRDDPDCRVFLGSLHAAGLGIDLTSASIVIHYDRWWNAARENQATDRVHRLGQTRGVQVYKLITKHSIEEKIDLMISKKQNLLEEIVSVDDHLIIKRFSRTEIINLLEGLGSDL